ncbi:MAG: hypothetical protein K0S44_3378, partial [Bacteroidetes bacterium]|nr:hypothetical protein [Bacteroidota bacterium]
MNKSNRKYIIVLVLCFAALIAIQMLAPKPISWKASYVKKDKIPYGTSALHQMLPFLFNQKNIIDKELPVYTLLHDSEIENTNYILINDQITLDTLEINELIKFARKGNHVFIAGNKFGEGFSSHFKVRVSDSFYEDPGFKTDSGTINVFDNSAAKINFTSKKLKAKEDYTFSKAFRNSYFTSIDTAKTVILGQNSNNKPNFISIKEGKGYFYFCSVPEVFTNYHFVNPRCKALSFLPVRDVIWDEYYKAGRFVDRSPLNVIFRHPSLLAAYYLLIISLLIFMIIGIKRKQRIIPIWKPLKNTTLKFVDVVGTLYYQKGDHKNMAEKKIAYFLDHLRTSFHLKTNEYNEEFIERMSNLSGIEKTKISDLFDYFKEISLKQKISQQELMTLEKKIEEFYSLNK